jgi:mitofusin
MSLNRHAINKAKARARRAERTIDEDDDAAAAFDGATTESSLDDGSPSSSSGRPGFATVGGGSGSEHTARLQQMLTDQDSGYGGSSFAGDDAALAWADATAAGGVAQHPDRHHQTGAVHQLWYNQHRSTLGRSIGRVIDMLGGLREMNKLWPAYYPSVQSAAGAGGDSRRRPTARTHSTSSVRSGSPERYDDDGSRARGSPSPTPMLRRAMTTVDEMEAAAAESSRAAERRRPAEPRLVTPQIERDFSVLKLDLKLGALHQAALVHSLEKSSIASLLDGKISISMRHLAALRERIEDTSSKVLITGDLNAGKSTFCNALLRRKVLPEDQQPCTAIFCEVLDARDNAGREEAHAVHVDSVYNRNDETTYDTYGLGELEDVVVDNETYHQCKIYVKDVRRVDESLLNNGVVDIALIDAPGLNSDTTKTTAIFARQEEIDVVVFVVSANNHFTMTANEFIMSAAAEKSYFFIVVNGYDNIRDKGRCQKQILKQVRLMSPQTAKEESELVHFVSSNAIPVAPPDGSGGSGGGGDEPDDDPKGKGRDVEKIRDFERLEQSLRRFVLEKRAHSKLAPAKTYLLNILGDLHVLATANSSVARTELDRVTSQLRELEPQLEKSKRACTDVSEHVENTIDKACRDIYDHARASLNDSIDHLGDDALGVPYPGLFGAFQYADALKEAMLSHVVEAVELAEDHARDETVRGVGVVRELGVQHLGKEYQTMNFRSDVMFRKKRDALARSVEVSTELWDFVDWSTILQRQEKVAGTGMALTVATAVVPRMIGAQGWLDHAMSAARLLGGENVRKLVIPGVIVAGLGAAYYVLSQIPQSLPHRISTKISAQLAAMDYVHANATRISTTVQKVLRIPADNLRIGLEQSVQQLGKQRSETLGVRDESSRALKYFSGLARESEAQRTTVLGVDLDALGPAAPVPIQ